MRFVALDIALLFHSLFSEPYVQLVTAYGSHGISSVFLIRMGCMPDQRDVIHRILRDGPSGGIRRRQGVVFD